MIEFINLFSTRYYDPSTGRFLSEDPIGFMSGDINHYRYVLNNPLAFVDPLGLAVGDWWDLVANFGHAFELAKVVQSQNRGHNNQGDAMRHAEWNRRMVIETNTFTAWVSGVGHELWGLVNGLLLREALMDLHNNAVGRRAGQNSSDININDLISLGNDGSYLGKYGNHERICYGN